MNLSNLNNQFVFADAPIRMLGLAIETEKNCLLWGPAGHAKSELVQAAFDFVFNYEDERVANAVFIQSFGPGMDEAKLFGGLDFRALDEEKTLRYDTQRSFLNYRYAIFEEFFDAPANVLQSLKDTLIAKELRNGDQRVKMKTKVIVAITNNSPDSISEIGPAAHALIERFPLQYEMKWQTYDAAAYIKLLETTHPHGNPEARDTLASLSAEATQSGNFISPRSCVHAFDILSNASQNGNNLSEHLADTLRFVPGYEGVLGEIGERLEAERARRAAHIQFTAVHETWEVVKLEATEASTPIHFLKFAKIAQGVEAELNGLKVTDDLTQPRQALLTEMSNFISNMQRKAMEAIQI